MIVVAIIGILSLIAIPSYQNYTKRTYITEGLTLAREFKIALSLSIGENGDWPGGHTTQYDNSYISFGPPVNYSGSATQSIQLISGYYGQYPDGSQAYNNDDLFPIGDLRRYNAIPNIKINFNQKVATNSFLILAPVAYSNKIDWVCLPVPPSISMQWLPAKCRKEIERYSPPSS